MHVWILIIAGIAIWGFSSIAVDSLIEHQHKRHPDAWLADGKPQGMFFKPAGSSYLAFTKLAFSWHKGAPGWVNKDPEAAMLYARVVRWNKVIKWYGVLFFPFLLLGAVL